MIYIIWEFYVDAAHIAAFEEIYSPQGAWASLFRQSKNYHGTELLKDHTEVTRYFTIDQWDNISDFEHFKTQHLAAYNELDDQCQNLTSVEKKVGVFVNK